MSTLARITTPVAVRVVTGLIQGFALYLLYEAAESRVWPATDNLVFAPLLVVASFLPIVVLMGVGNMRARTLAIWTICAALLLVGLSAHDMLRDPERLGVVWSPWSPWSLANPTRGVDLRLFPSTRFLPAVLLVLFILQTLVVAGDAGRKLIGAYSVLFEVAWKHAVQLALSLLFVGLFWLMLALGAALFNLIDLDFLKRLIQHGWFAKPATTLAFACAIHVTDVRSGIVRGVRTLIHVLLSWLLPLTVLFAVGFLASLPFTGLAPLWSTRFATSLLLTVAFVSVLLVNATYQDGEVDRAVPWLLKQAASTASLVLIPLVALATYALALRIEQHGWSSDRIFAAAAIAVATTCALGYTWAVVRPRGWLKGIEICNVVAAFVALGAVLALYTPIADPARISVADQIARLESGRTPVADFDFAYLRFDGGRYGQAALERLKENASGPDAGEIKQRVETVLLQQHRWDRAIPRPTAETVAKHITVYPIGRTLPDGFAEQDWTAVPAQKWLLPQCLTNSARQCEAFFLDLSATGSENILLLDATVPPLGVQISPGAKAVVFRHESDGKWQMAGTFSTEILCPAFRDALRSANFKMVPAALEDIEINGTRLPLFTPSNPVAKCP